MRKKQFLELKQGQKFTHDDHPGLTFKVNMVGYDGFNPFVDTQCGRQFYLYEFMHLLDDQQHPTELKECEDVQEQLIAILKQPSNHCELSPGSLKRFAGMLSAYFGIEVKDNQAADVMIILNILKLGESNGTA